MPERLDLNEYKMALFDNGNPEKFLLFVRNFNMILKDSGTLEPAAKAWYFRMLVCGEELRQFDLLFAAVKIAKPLTVEANILGLGANLFLLIRYQSKSAQRATE